MAKLLILTLNSGEAALPLLTRQLAAQSFQDFEHEVINGLPNRAANNHLFRTIRDRASSFDLFLRLDADMTLRADTSLAEAVRGPTNTPTSSTSHSRSGTASRRKRPSGSTSSAPA